MTTTIVEDVQAATDETEAVFLALGAASACWEHLESAGVFDSERCRDIGLALCERLGIAVPAGYGPPLAPEPTDA